MYFYLGRGLFISPTGQRVLADGFRAAAITRVQHKCNTAIDRPTVKTALLKKTAPTSYIKICG